MAQKVVYVPGSSRKICQLTGEYDYSMGREHPTVNRTGTRFGLRGTDLGASFEHKGRCWFLFGDTHPTGPNNDLRPFDGDTIAVTDDKAPSEKLKLDFLTAPDGLYKAIHAPGVSMKGFEVPTGGFSARGWMYIFFTSDVKFVKGKGAVMGRSVLLRSKDDGRTFESVYTVSRDRLIYIAPVIVENARWPGLLPESRGNGLLLWSSSTEYRRSNPYLAYIPLDRVEDKAALRYFSGVDTKTGHPKWSRQESDAAPLFTHPCIGELDVTWNPHLRRYLMLYNCDDRVGPRGINFRVSETPWGPWSETPALLFDPWKDRGYCHFMHRGGKPSERCDTAFDPGREADWGGEYGAYVISRFTTGSRSRTTLYYVMSTWNPYNTVLMTSTLELQP